MLFDLRVNDLFQPIGVDGKIIKLSWKISSRDYNVFQEKFNIIIYNGEKMIWESGINKTNESFFLLDSEILESGKWYSWSVSVEDNYSKTHKSKKSIFFTGDLNGRLLKKSKWICADFKTLPLFGKEFSVEDKLESAVMFSTALGNYEAYINGERIGNKIDNRIIYDELKPGFTESKMHVHYHSFNILPFVRSGNNVISVITGDGWWLGRIAASHETHVMNPDRQGEKIAFKAVIRLKYESGKEKIIYTDENWKASIASPLKKSDIYDGETWDLINNPRWNTPNLDDNLWETVNISNEFDGVITTACGHNVYVRDDLKRNGVVKNRTYPYSMGKYDGECVDFGQNLVGYEKLNITTFEPTTIMVYHAESLGVDGKLDFRCNRDAETKNTYIVDKCGEITISPLLTYHGFRYIYIISDKPILINKVEAEVISSIKKEDEIGYLNTNDSNINRLISNALWSQRGNFSTVPTDCPQRDERHAFTGDVQIYCTTAAYYTNCYEYLKKWLFEDVYLLQHTDGSFPSTAPQSRQVERYGMAGWSDGGIIIPYKLYKMYGDKRILEDAFPYLIKFMQYLEKNDGPGNHYGDWATPVKTDNTQTLKDFLADVYYCIDLKYFIDICKILSKDYKKYEILLKARLLELKNKYVCECGFKPCLNDLEGQTSQTACAYVIYYDLITEENILNKIKEQFKESILHYDYCLHTGFLGTPILLKALTKAGFHEEAFKTLLQSKYPSWLYAVKNNATTIWEYWNGTNSQNHFAYGAVVEWLFEEISGITPEINSAGYKHFTIKPQFNMFNMLNGLKFNYNSSLGMIKSHMKIVENKIQYEFQVPPNSTATIVIPENFEKEYQLKNKFGSIINGLIEKGSIKYEVGSGKYFYSNR